jgi:phosphohistidine phosphatase
MAKTLVVLRHAKSAWPDGVPDFDRPLGERGLRDAPAVGHWLNKHVPDLDLVVHSPAARAKETWELVAAELTAKPEVRKHAKIYYGPVLEVVTQLPQDVETAMIVGHNPDLEDLVELLTGTHATFKTSTVAVLRSEKPWDTAGPGWAELISVATPRG